MGSNCACSKKQKVARVTQLNQSPQVLITHLTEENHGKFKLWDDVLKDFAYFNEPLQHFYLQNPNQLKHMLIWGPPTELRWKVWKACFKYTPRALADKQINPECMQLIEKDLERTFPFHPFFINSANLQSLKELLINIVRLNPDLGYCQGMNYVAGIFLFVSKCKVEESTAMMDIFINELQGKGLFEPEFPKVTQLALLFTESFKAKLPSLYNHFKMVELDDHLWLTKWFMTMFSYSFKIDYVVRLWDVIFATSIKFMVPLAIGILDLIKKRLMQKSFEELIEYFPILREVSLDIENVILNTFRSSSGFSHHFDDAMKETDPDFVVDESQFRLHLDSIEQPRRSQQLNFLNIDTRKRSNSLVIQQNSPKLT
jgi:hypothetical protein